MHLVDEHDAVPISSTSELIEYFTTAGKPPDQWRVGTEHELIGVLPESGEPPTYDGPRGIRALLEAFAKRGGTPVTEHDHPIAVSRGDAQITIEPGGQFEFAARPVDDDRTFASELATYITELGEASRELDLAWLSIGLRPFGARDDIPWMKKQRYEVMRAYMPTVGSRGLDMMLRTATVQANLDFSDEQDAFEKLRCVYSITSIVTALWACSSLAEDRPNGFQSYRAWIWRDTDNARAGMPPFVFDREDIFHAYTEWALDVPMYFVHRGGYRAVPADLTFRRFMRDGWGDAGGDTTRATISDWALHLSTLFPEGRLKKFIEVRGADCGSLEMIVALAPMMRGLLYDATARAAATALTSTLTHVDRQHLADDVPARGFQALAGRHTIGDLAVELVAIARDGLSRVAPDALSLLDPVEQIARSRRTQADALLELWSEHGGDRVALVRALAHPGLG